MGPGDVIAETYEVIRRLGAGGMGTVFEAKHLRLPKRVAVKVLTAAPDPELLARFRLEAEIASRLDHPHIVEMLDLGTLPSGAPYMVMELLDGENLRARMRRGKPALVESLRFVKQIASALRAAHGSGVIHRDLKPENVFLTRDGLTGADHVKLLDFGISKVQGIALTANNVVLGTPAYMAPEQATGATLDARVDQFALAMIAYELVAGALPFGEQDSTKIMHMIAYEPIAPLATRDTGAPAHVVAAIDRALSKAPRERFESMGDFMDALDGKDVPPPPIDEGPATVYEHPRRRRRWWLPGLALMIASVGVTSTLLVVLRSSSTAPITDSIDAGIIDALIAQPAIDAGVIDAPVDASLGDADAAIIDKLAVDATPPVDATRAVPSRDAVRSTTVRSAPEEVPPEVAADLSRAQAALDSGHPADATRFAKLTLVKPTRRAYLILVEAACRANDLAAARGWMRAMPSAIQSRAKKICSALGLEL